MASRLKSITTRNGTVKQSRTAAGIEIVFRWDGGKPPEIPPTAQAMFDQECLRVIEPYVPIDTGLLKNTAIMATTLGSGELRWLTPYAAAQYYNTADSRDYDDTHLRGGHWGERAKADNLDHLAKFAKEVSKPE